MIKRNHNTSSSYLRAGEWVEVRSQDQILATLDDRGCLENLPFMPEMLQYCGKKFPVYKRADKTCDTISGGRKRSRQMRNAVHLTNLRCGGDSHGGCDNTCLIFWKEAWLKRVQERDEESVVTIDGRISKSDGGIGTSKYTIGDLSRAVRSSENNDAFVCQATELVKATSPIPWWDIRHFARDLTSGNVGIIEFTWVLSLRLLNYTCQKIFHRWFYPHMPARFMLKSNTPYEILNLQPGDIVKVKSIEEILMTLKNWRNRGLYYDESGEMYKYCNKKFKVLKRVRRVMNEKTGELIELKNESVILDGVICCGHYSPGRLLCPRSLYPFWREIWLTRVETEKMM